MANQTSITANIFDELLSTVESIGVEKTIKILQEGRVKMLTSQDLSVDLIINVVVQVTGVSRERILYGRDRTDERKMAVALCIFFIKREFKYSLKDLEKTFGKDSSMLHRYDKMIKELPKSSKNEFEKQLKEHCNKVELLITSEKIK